MEIVLLFAAVILFGLGALLAGWDLKARTGATKGTGTIVGYARARSANGGMYYAVVEFVGIDGETRYVKSTVGSSSPLGYVGKTTGVLLRRDDPERAEVDSKFAPALGLILIFLGAGCGYFFFRTFRTDPTSLIVAGITTLFCLRGAYRAWKKARPNGSGWAALKKLDAEKRVFTQAEKSSIAWIEPSEISEKQRKIQRSQKAAAPVLLILALGGLLLAAYFYDSTSSFLKVAVRAKGRVVEMVPSRGSKGTTYAPLIEFVPSGASGPRRFKHSISSNPPGYQSGEEVDVLYDPRNPSDARIDLGALNFLGAMISGALGLLCLAGAVHGFKVARRRVPDELDDPASRAA